MNALWGGCNRLFRGSAYSSQPNDENIPDLQNMQLVLE